MDSNRSGRVIVGVSNSLAGYQALRYAVGEARRRGADLIAVRAYRYSYYGGASQFALVVYQAAQAEVAAALSEALGGPPRDVTTRVRVCEGGVAGVLAAIADRPDDVIVIGASRPGRAFGRPRGRVARDCSRRAGCPVVMIPVPEMARAGSQARLARRAVDEVQHFVGQG